MKKLKDLSFLFCVISCVAMVLTGCGSKEAPSITTITNTVTNFTTSYVTNSITNDVIKEVVKEVQVPANIPKEYVDGYNLSQRLVNATYVNSDQALYQMKDVKVAYDFSEGIKQTVLEDEVKAKFELTLRKNNVPLNPASKNTVSLSIHGFYNTEGTLLCYSIELGVIEMQWTFRNGECHQSYVTVWTKGNSFGTVGKAKANEALLDTIQKCSEVFANDFLSANPK